ncbi:Malonyl CoA-acyl carrier protein transacylase [uncultured Desulfobacterium sp.]|uniref:Malonyl CoA-acyl carrier protein transacylase n=1 Tax=uncultured Desulfobacterium sp. TaxID=201089 RepID=A0A445MZS8_9BACT|nr:Malonyl CoA-acyl carrier protein transacylase [uncultured Desulfobacterium sp.]
MTRKDEHKVAFLYPGQGSQRVGMGLELYNAYPEAKRLFDQADDLLGFSLTRLCLEGPEDELNQDLNAQLAVYTISCIVTDIMINRGIRPDVTSGYSSGFYGAAYGAGCFDFARGLEIVRRAGEILLDEGKKIRGTMAVIFGLSPDQVEDICKRAKDVWVAIRNTPRQTVISGAISAVERAMEIARMEGALDAYPLNVSAPYHSELVEASEARLLETMEDDNIQSPLVPVVSYLSLDYISEKSRLKKIMAAQLSRPVLWVDLIRKIGADTELMIEVGPGAVIARTVMWIDRGIEIINTDKESGLIEAMERCGV